MHHYCSYCGQVRIAGMPHQCASECCQGMQCCETGDLSHVDEQVQEADATVQEGQPGTVVARLIGAGIVAADSRGIQEGE